MGRHFNRTKLKSYFLILLLIAIEVPIPFIADRLSGDRVVDFFGIWLLLGFVGLLLWALLILGTLIIYRRLKLVARKPRFMEWMRGKLRFYREFGFYAEHRELSDDVLADQVFEKFQFPFLPLIYPDLDLIQSTPFLIMALDERRVLTMEDPSSYYVFAEEGSFLFVECLTRISRGRFQPENLRAVKTVDSYEDEVVTHVEFDFQGKRESLVWEYVDDRLVPKCVELLNRLIGHTGYRYVYGNVGDVSGHGPLTFITVLNDEEMACLRSEAQWENIEE